MEAAIGCRSTPISQKGKKSFICCRRAKKEKAILRGRCTKEKKGLTMGKKEEKKNMVFKDNYTRT